MALLVWGAVVALDQAAKASVLSVMAPGDVAPIVPGVLSLAPTRNTGVAFGLFSGMGLAPALLAATAVVAAIWAARGATRGTAGAIMLAALLGGATGNAIDRVRYGYVIDFIELPWWPVFNLADAAIVLGAAALVWRTWRGGRRASESSGDWRRR